MFLHYVGGRDLGIFHQSAAAVAVDINRHIPLIEPRHTQGSKKSIRQLFPLDAGIISRAVARLMNLVEVGCPQKHVVIVEFPLVVAEIADWRVKLLMIRAARETSLHVIYHTVARHKSAVIPLVAQVRQVGPAVDIGLRQPKMIHAKTAAGIAVTEHDHAFADWLVILRPQSRETSGRTQAVRG